MKGTWKDEKALERPPKELGFLLISYNASRALFIHICIFYMGINAPPTIQIMWQILVLWGVFGPSCIRPPPVSAFLALSPLRSIADARGAVKETSIPSFSRPPLPFPVSCESSRPTWHNMTKQRKYRLGERAFASSWRITSPWRPLDHTRAHGIE